MAHEFDPYALGSGLPLADADVTVTAMEFRFDTNYSADACVAAITFQPDEGEAQEQLYSCGKGWEPVDRGDATAHVSGRPLNFNANSNYGRFLAAAFACDGFLDEAREAGVLPTESALFVGKRFHLGTIQITTKNPSTGVESTKDLIVPDEYLGEGEDEEVTTTPAKKAPAKKAAAKAAPAKGPSAIEKKQLALVEELEAEDADLVEALRELAAESEDHESFMEAAMELEGVADSELAQQVAMSSKAGSIWATSQA